MKIIEKSSKKSQPAEGRGAGLGSLRLGRGMGGELQAQETIISMLGRLLDNRFALVRNVELPDTQVIIPMLLIGPPGVKVLLPVGLRGVYRARLDEWEQLDELRQNFKPATPNLLIHAQQLEEAVQAFLKAHSYRPSSVEAVLIFTDPGVYVEMVKPAVRIVLIDALERFIAGLLQSPPYQDKGEVQAIVDVFTRILEAPGEASPVPEQDVFSLVEERPRSKLPELVTRLPRGDKAVSALNKIPFTTRQWYLLGCLLIVNIVILLAFVVFILISS